MRRRLDHCIFLTELVLPRQRVPLSRILSLGPGDVLQLSCPLKEAGDLLVSGKALFKAHAVRTGVGRAAQVDARVHTLGPTQKESS
jgi:flagellar motor switch protein FliM